MITTASSPPSHFAVDVADLPWPANPGRRDDSCFIDQLSGKLHAPGQPSVSWKGQQCENRSLILDLPEEKLTTCPYHQGAWQKGSELAVKLLISGTDPTNEQLVSVGWTQGAISIARDLLSTDRAIEWDAGSGLLNDGQHRVCAMKALAVTRTVVYGNPPSLS